MLIKNAKIITMNNKEIENGFIIIKNGKIEKIDNMKKLPKFSGEIIDVKGKLVLPGFIDAHTHLGLSEDGVGNEGEDINEMSDPITPQVRAIDAINPLDKAFLEAVEMGVTTNIVGPGSANPIAGEIVAIKSVGRSVEEMEIEEFLAMKFAMGENPKKVYGNQDQQPFSRMATAALIRETLFKAQRYMEAVEVAKDSSDLPEFELKYENLIPVLKGEAQAHFHAHRAYDIQTAIRISEEFQLDYVIIHGTEGFMITDYLKEKGARVVCGPIITTRSKPELSNQTLNNVNQLIRAGVATAVSSDHPEVPAQYLALSASLLTGHGLTWMEALESITSVPARMLGLEKRVGMLKVGLDADILVFSENPMERNVKPEMVFINGIKINS